MTNEEARALYGRAVAAGFRLEPGCRARRPHSEMMVTVAWMDGILAGIVGDCYAVITLRPDELWCDFREAPSLGCLLKQVRAEWCHPTLHLAHDWRGRQCAWKMVALGDGRGPDGLHITARTEAETLVAALEAAPVAWDVKP